MDGVDSGYDPGNNGQGAMNGCMGGHSHSLSVTVLCPTNVLIPPQVVADFAADGCIYLELRTTPKVQESNVCVCMGGQPSSIPASGGSPHLLGAEDRTLGTVQLIRIGVRTQTVWLQVHPSAGLPLQTNNVCVHTTVDLVQDCPLGCMCACVLPSAGFPVMHVLWILCRTAPSTA